MEPTVLHLLTELTVSSLMYVPLSSPPLLPSLGWSDVLVPYGMFHSMSVVEWMAIKIGEMTQNGGREKQQRGS